MTGLDWLMQENPPNNELTLNPVPSILIESLRDIGYTFRTALADIVDNSLSAGATEIQIEARAVPSPAVGIIDNGAGLNRDELLDSMRMGSRDPKQARDLTDLGRFGLGMKTASFSQCRRLTVVSRQNGATAAFMWDLDRVVELNESYSVGELLFTAAKAEQYKYLERSLDKWVLDSWPVSMSDAPNLPRYHSL